MSILTPFALPPISPLVVGVSGGADSLALLALLRETGQALIVAHFNHQLRPEADADEAHVRAVAEKLGMLFTNDSADVAAYAAGQRLSPEEAARKLRYTFLFRVARERGAAAVAVAHTADDQAETVLMHFLRGAGLSGLKGMLGQTLLTEFDDRIPLIRPILHLTRSETEAVCHAKGLDFRLDASNADTTYFRNRLRHELIPLLETYNPQVRAALVRTANSLQGDFELLNNLLDETWQACVKATGVGYIAFDYQNLLRQPEAMRRNLLRRAAFSLRPGLRDVDFGALVRSTALKDGDFTGGLALLREGDTLYLAAYEADLPRGNFPLVIMELDIARGEWHELPNGWRLLCEPVAFADYRPEDEWTAWLDAESVIGRLAVRPARAGDYFCPLGMNGKSVKLSDLFVNLKIPRRMRGTWPVVTLDDEIAWVVGLRRAEVAAVQPGTKRILRIRLIHTGG